MSTCISTGMYETPKLKLSDLNAQENNLISLILWYLFFNINGTKI